MDSRIPFLDGSSDRFIFEMTQPLRIHDPWTIAFAVGLGLLLAGFIALLMLISDD